MISFGLDALDATHHSGETPDGVITSWNPGAERIFGYPASEAIGRKGDFFVPQDLLAKERLALESTAQSGEVQNYESLRRRNDDEVIPVSVTLLLPRSNSSRLRNAGTCSSCVSEILLPTNLTAAIAPLFLSRSTSPPAF